MKQVCVVKGIRFVLKSIIDITIEDTSKNLVNEKPLYSYVDEKPLCSYIVPKVTGIPFVDYCGTAHYQNISSTGGDFWV